MQPLGARPRAPLGYALGPSVDQGVTVTAVDSVVMYETCRVDGCSDDEILHGPLSQRNPAHPSCRGPPAALQLRRLAVVIPSRLATLPFYIVISASVQSTWTCLKQHHHHHKAY